MNVVVTLLARDNVDITAALIEYYLAEGVRAIIVTDNGSTDGALEVLEDYEHAGAITLLHEPGDDYRQSEWVSRMARIAASDYAAEWVLNVDADEFWRSSDPRLGLVDVLAAQSPDTGMLVARRHDLRGRGGLGGGWFSRLKWLDRQTISERGTPLGVKVAHRASADAVVAMGNHDVSGVAGSRVDSGVLEIVHIPLRSWRQFSQKVRVGGAAVERNANLNEDAAWHWRADYVRLQSGELQAEYWARAPRASELLLGLISGRVRRERRLQRRLTSIAGVLPDRLKQSLAA